MSPSEMLALLLISFISNALCQDADMPGHPAKMETIVAGSWIIPMDNTLQGTNLVFKETAYGLVNAFLWANIPVKWAIRSGKKHDEWDFNASARLILPTPQTTPTTRLTFRSGPFIIPYLYLNPNNPGPKGFVNVTQLVLNYTKQFTRPPVVYRLEQTTTIDIKMTIFTKPFAAVLDSSDQNTIQTDVLAEVGFVAGKHFRIMSKEQAVNIGARECVTVATEPHFHATQDSGNTYRLYPNTFVSAMRKFIKSGGNFLAQCAGIATYEQCDNIGTSGNDDPSKPPIQDYCPSGFFMSQGGFNLDEGTSETTQDNLVADTPFAQFNGAWTVEGGSVPRMTLWNTRYDPYGNTTLRASTRAHWVIQERGSVRTIPDNGIYYAAHAKLPEYFGKKGGNIFYLAGHNYGNAGEAGRRLYMNAIFHMAYRPGCDFDINPCSWGNFAREFRGDVFIQDPQMRNGGIAMAKIEYSWSQDFIGIKYSQAPLTESYLFNDARGVFGYDDQVVIKSSTGCCSFSRLENTMPVLFPCLEEFVYDGTVAMEAIGDIPARTCTKLTPTQSLVSNVIEFLLIDPNTTNLCYYKEKTGRQVWFRTFTPFTSTAPFNRTAYPRNVTTCVCKKQLDIALVIDRRQNMTTVDFASEKALVAMIASKFDVSTTSAQFTLINYNTDAWTSLRLNEGTQPITVSNALNTLSCCPVANRTLCATANPAACCCGAASISSGIRLAAQELKTSVRSTSAKVMVVITTGYHNTRFQQPAWSCYSSCARFREGSPSWESCVAPLVPACLQDLRDAVTFAYGQIPALNLYAFGIGNYSWDELQIIGSTSSSAKIITAVDFPDAFSKTDLPAQICTHGQDYCTLSCCGICGCSNECLAPAFCNSPLFCVNTTVVDGCCQPSPLDCNAKTGNTNKCLTPSCEEAGRKCDLNPVQCPVPNQCYDYVCQPTKGLPCVPVEKWSPEVCFVKTCDTNSMTVLKEPKCGFSPNLCFTPDCNPVTEQCSLKDVPPPALTDSCLTVKCNTSATTPANLWIYQETAGCRCKKLGCSPCEYCNENNTACLPIPCTPPNECLTSTYDTSESSCCRLDFACSDNNNCTRDTCESGRCVRTPVVCNDGNACTEEACNPLSGKCDHTFIPLPNETVTGQCYRASCNSSAVGLADLFILTEIPGCLGCNIQCPPCTECQKNGTNSNGENTYHCVEDTCPPQTCFTATYAPLTPSCCAYNWSCDDGNKCTKDTCTATGCASVPVVCDDGNPCTNNACNPATGECDITPVSPPANNDTCLTLSCNSSSTTEAGLWVYTEIPGCRCRLSNCSSCYTCSADGRSCIAKTCPPLACHSDAFDPSLSTCCAYTFLCNDNDTCTTDSCVSDLCTYTPITCSDSNMCTSDSCTDGKCAFVPAINICTDNNTCTNDACNDFNQSCDFTPVNCDFPNDVCRADVCEVGSGLCRRVDVDCDDQNLCTVDSCHPTFGCLHDLKTCNNTDSPCEIWSCDFDSGNCTSRPLPCAPPFDATLLGAALSSGIIASIIIAAVIVACAVGGGTYAYQHLGVDGPDAAINSNPLYEGSGTNRDNPLFHH